MPSVRVSALGGLDIAVDGHPVEWLSSQRMRAAFLAFVAVERELSRDRLTGIFWPEADSDRARRSLSQVIYTIRRSLGEGTILTEGDRVRIGADVAVDVARFLAAVEAGEFAEALRHYRGPLLQAHAFAGSAEFEQWLDAKRASLERLHRRAARGALDRLTAAGDVATALRVAQEWCELDPEEDEAQHRYIALLIQSGRRREAIRHFDAHRERLRAANLEPLEETVALVAQLRGAAPPAASASVAPAAPAQAAAEIVGSDHSEPVTRRGIGALVAELRRRRVLGTASVYALLAWGAIQFSTTVFPTLGLPDWAPTLIVVLALMGLPFALFFAWMYDVTPEGIRRTPPAGVPSPPRARRLRPAWLVALVAAPVALYGGWTLYGSRSEEPFTGSVAVFPFCVAGADLENQGEDVAQLVARQVDAVPELRTADPNVVIASAATLNCRDARAAARLASGLGATRFMLGSVTAAAEEIRADATLYDTDGTMLWAATASTESGDLMDVVDLIVRRIVEQQGISVRDRLLSVAATTTRSRDALRAFLDGERAMRIVDWRGASEAYRRAVQIDSTFALAWFRLAVSIRDWGGPFEQRLEALEHAQRHASHLPEREQRLLYAFDPFLRGRAAEAHERLHAYLGLYPDDPQAWSFLGDLEYEAGALLGHDFQDAVDAQARAARLGNRDALFMLAWAYWDAGDYPRSDSVLALVHATGAGGEWVIGLDAVRAFRSGDPARVQAMLDTIETRTAEIRGSSIAWALWAGNLGLGEELAERPLAAAGLERAPAAAIQLAARARYHLGKLAALRELFGRLAALDPDAALRLRAAIALNPALPDDARELREIRGGLDALERAGEADVGSHARAARLYLAGRISIALGEFEAAEAYAASLERLPPPLETPTENANLAAAVRAHEAARRGDTAAARAWLDRIVLEVPFYVDHHDYEREVGLRAELLARTGRIEEAARWYRRVAGDYGPYVEKRRGELYEQLGDRAAAIASYRKLLEQLSDCGPELRPVKAFAEARLAALGS